MTIKKSDFTKKDSYKIGVVIPCYKVRHHILDVIAKIPDFVDVIYAVDDCCPDQSGAFISEHVRDTRLKLLKNPQNMGVGGATITGYRQAILDQCDIIAKIDGDGQMNPDLLVNFIKPIIDSKADYTKGNRFYKVEHIKKMPLVRIIGNTILSFVTKISSGYWNIFDPLNGYTCITRKALTELPLEKISNRYFFESDMLFRLNTIRCVIIDIPMKAVYEDEKSNLDIKNNAMPFIKGNISNFTKRIFYNYFLRNFSFASICLVFGLSFSAYGVAFGFHHWMLSIISNKVATTGTVMISVVFLVTGIQLLLSFINHDISNQPSLPISYLGDNHENKI